MNFTTQNREYRTQRVTAADINAGQIRIPSVNTAKTKSLFPSEPSTVTVVLRGHTLNCDWNPRMGPDRERSGVLRIGAILRTIVRADEELHVSHHENVSFVIS